MLIQAFIFSYKEKKKKKKKKELTDGGMSFNSLYSNKKKHTLFKLLIEINRKIIKL